MAIVNEDSQTTATLSRVIFLQQATLGKAWSQRGQGR